MTGRLFRETRAKRRRDNLRRTRLLPTPAGWCAIAVAAVALGIPRPNIETSDPRPFVGMVLILAVLGELLLVLVDRKPFTASVIVPTVLRCDEDGTVHVSVRDPLPNQRVRYLTTHKLNEQGHVSFDVAPRQRGVFRLRDLQLEDTGPIGLIRRSRVINPTTSYMVCVGPKRSRQDGDTAAVATTFPNLDTELDRLRTYVVGDDVRLLNWRSTARTGHPMVEVRQSPAHEPVVVIDLGAVQGAKAEAWASLAAGALQRLIQLGPVVVRSRDAQGETTRTITNDRHIDIVLGSAVTGEPVSMGIANLYIGAWRSDLVAAERDGMKVITDTDTAFMIDPVLESGVPS